MAQREAGRGWRTEWSIPAFYAALAGAWIYGSDALVAGVAGSIERQRVISTYKGFAFVAITAALLHAGLRLSLRRERSAARRVRESEALLRAVTDAIPEPVFLKALDGAWIFSNPATLQVIGKRMDEVLGHTDAEIYQDPSVGAPLMETDRRVLATGQAEVVEERIHGPQGYRTFLSTKAPWRDAEGRVVGLIGTARDITDRKRAQQELLAAEEKFQQAQRLESVGRLAGGVAHDFNNLLTVILGASEALEEDLQAGRAVSQEDLDQIRAATGRAQELTRQLLAFARRQVTSPVALDLGEAVRGSARLLRRALSEGVELTVDLAPGSSMVRCDAGQIEQIIMNLSMNARDAMPRGGRLTLRTRLRQVDAAEGAGDERVRAGDWVVLEVEDSGEGMTPEVLSHLYEPFFTTKPKGLGTGLGLATVYGIVTQAGGHVQVRSAPGQGTHFEIHLPRLPAGGTTAAAAPAVRDRAAPMARGTETVLAVEDDPLVREVTARALRGGGYRVLVAAGGEEALALEAGLSGPLGLLVTDVVMPGMDGRTLADALRRRRPGLRVLYVSGYTQDVISHHGVLDEGVELLPKPFTTGELLTRVRTLLDRPAEGGPARTGPDPQDHPKN